MESFVMFLDTFEQALLFTLPNGMIFTSLYRLHVYADVGGVAKFGAQGSFYPTGDVVRIFQ